MAHCRYNSLQHGLLMPVTQTVNGLQLFNIEPRQTSLVNHLILRKVITDKKKRTQHEQSLEYMCSKQFCSFCLKNFYEIVIQDAQKNQNWICPHCTGQCFCSRCMRQDQMTKVRAYLLSISGKQIEEHCLQSPSDIMTVL